MKSPWRAHRTGLSTVPLPLTTKWLPTNQPGLSAVCCQLAALTKKDLLNSDSFHLH